MKGFREDRKLYNKEKDGQSDYEKMKKKKVDELKVVLSIRTFPMGYT